MTDKKKSNSNSGLQAATEKNTEAVPSTNRPTPLANWKFPFALVIALTLLSGILHGVMDGRWSRPKDLILQGEKLSQVPEQLGDWSLDSVGDLDDAAAQLLNCYGSNVCIYRHVPTDETVTVAVLFGPRGPIAVHTPEICYSSVGTKQVGERKVETISDGKEKHQLWAVKFAQNPLPDPALDVWYGWSDGESWVASEYPRFWMTNNLYKIQVAGPIGDDGFRPCESFLREFLPAIEFMKQ